MLLFVMMLVVVVIMLARVIFLCQENIWFSVMQLWPSMNGGYDVVHVV